MTSFTVLPKYPALLWMLAVVAACTVPGSSLPSTSLLEYDKLIHFLIFVPFGWLWMAALRMPVQRRTWLVLGGGALFAVLTELYQSLLPFQRHPDPYDALADTLGACAGVLFYRLRPRSRT